MGTAHHVEIVISSNQDAGRVAELVAENLKRHSGRLANAAATRRTFMQRLRFRVASLLRRIANAVAP